ncbi:hypothetical protein MKW94_015079 [Papaver nudicaule]|uniref:Uncharacterized protein n=1 Tax=Papaver nudicaule TaxID=74823 RepID=A0AA41VM21_PAPNU|nr:hypothetical protein [Papaver nudicaule]
MLKAKALRETKHKKSISSLQALLAHVWTAVVRARVCLTDNHDESRRQVLVALFMSNRTKLIPALPDAYFGNSLCWGDTLGFGFLASSLNEVVNSHNYEKNRSFIESWVEKPHIPSSSDDNGTMGSINDFGWGQPIAVKTGPNGKFYGLTTVSPGPVEGSIDIEIVLPVEVFKAMENDAEFTEAMESDAECSEAFPT